MDFLDLKTTPVTDFLKKVTYPILSIQFHQLWIKQSNSHIRTCKGHSVSQHYKSLPYHAVVSFRSPIKSSLCFSHALDVWLLWNTVDLPEETLLEKSDFSFPSSNRLPMVRGEILCFPPFSMLEFSLAQACPDLVYAVTTTVSSYVQLRCCVQKV